MAAATDLAAFARFQASFEAEAATRENIRTVVRELEGHTRTIAMVLATAHIKGADVNAICTGVRARFDGVHAGLNQIKALVTPERFYRYNDLWRFVVQQLIFFAAFVVFLESQRCVTLPELETMLGMRADVMTEFHFDVEDFLFALCNLCNELSRLAVNSVIAEDYGRPLVISRFVSELYAGFQLLNLKNDGLRKRFDGIKYDIKKIEEIVYDISIRGLTRTDRAAGAPQ